MAESSDELSLVQCISRHLHPPHRRHLLVQIDEEVFRDGDLEGRHVAIVGIKRLFMKCEVEGFGFGFRCGFCEFGGIG